VLANVLANGINYTPDKGEITITAEEEGDMVEIRVRDTGIGIPPEQLERIFEKFQQIPGRESSSTSLGLGLYIVKIILEGHGMKVWAKSTEGKGSSFYFTLEKSIKKRENAGHEQDGKEQY
jgi:signal transduction histidine kinase